VRRIDRRGDVDEEATVVERVRRNEKQWTEIVQRFKSSGMGVAAFCRKERVSENSFRRWRPRVDAAVHARFVELVPARPPAELPASEAPEGWALSLRLPNGTVLQLRG
jgi:hypothetical protein